MNLEEYIADRERRDPEFKKAGEELRPLYEYRDALVKARLSAGLTQRQLADALCTSQSAVSRMENGTFLPSMKTLFSMASVLGVEFSITPAKTLKVRRESKSRRSSREKQTSACA